VECGIGGGPASVFQQSRGGGEIIEKGEDAGGFTSPSSAGKYHSLTLPTSIKMGETSSNRV